jgi:uncharacterized membrane protein HdeD (DUF308 family)
VLIALANGWWLLTLRGIAGLCFGLAAYTEPGITLATLAYLYSGYALIDGGLAILEATQALCADARWGVLFLEGVVGLAIGLAAIPWPAVTLPNLLWPMALRALVIGLAEIVTTARLRTRTCVEWLPGLGGLASLAFIVVAVAMPVRDAIDLALCAGGCAMISGPLLVVFGYWLRTWIKSNNLGDYVPSHALSPRHRPAASSRRYPGSEPRNVAR